MITVTEPLQSLHDAFASEGFKLWFVGGCVRDAILGEEPKDVDLCTDASPDEQIAVYKKHKIWYVKTGFKHGTISAKRRGIWYEVTSLRTETDHDGRHAVVNFTNDLIDDLSRRDLTINAIACDFSGNIIDPYNGRIDIMNGTIKFVGKAEERMKEDYLRILRFFRFHSRFSKDNSIEKNALIGIVCNAEGLKRISVERIWIEMKKIISSPKAVRTLQLMNDVGVLREIGFPFEQYRKMSIAIANKSNVNDPSSILGFYLNAKEIYDLSSRWKWSKAERERALFIARNSLEKTIDQLKELLVDNHPIEWVLDLANFWGVKDRENLTKWEIPLMPVNGDDLIKLGMTPGIEMAEVLKEMKLEWKKSNYNLANNILIMAHHHQIISTQSMPSES